MKVKDVMGNVTRLAEELRSFAHVSDETIGRVLEADISHAPVRAASLTPGRPSGSPGLLAASPPPSPPLPGLAGGGGRPVQMASPEADRA